MYFIGEMNIKDKRVDKMLATDNINNADIYYSPIIFWILSLVVILCGGVGVIAWLALHKYYLFFLFYFSVSYFISSYLNNSFALTEKHLHVINPNIPFKKIKSYDLSNIKQITIGKTKRKWHYVLGIFGSNYITIQTTNKSEKYFCIGLEIDAFDENWTEKTIDNFNYKLREKNIQTVFNIE